MEQNQLIAACVNDDAAPYLSGCRYEHWLVGKIESIDRKREMCG